MSLPLDDRSGVCLLLLVFNKVKLFNKEYFHDRIFQCSLGVSGTPSSWTYNKKVGILFMESRLSMKTKTKTIQMGLLSCWIRFLIIAPLSCGCHFYYLVSAVSFFLLSFILSFSSSVKATAAEYSTILSADLILLIFSPRRVKVSPVLLYES